MASARIPLPHRGVLALSGEDVHGFLQGLLSNDIEPVREGRAVYAALLTPQGKFLHDVFAVEREGVVYLDSEADRLGDLAKLLRRYRLRAKIAIEDASGAWAVEAVPDGAAHFGLAGAEPGATARFGGGVACVDPRDGRFGVRLLRPAEESTGLPEGGFADYEALRYRLGAPDGSRDMPVGQAFLLESGFERLNGVDWQKGCYVGQEVTARTHYRGAVRRQLTTVALDGAVAPGARITVAGTPGRGNALQPERARPRAAAPRPHRGRRRAGSRRRPPPRSCNRRLTAAAANRDRQAAPAGLAARIPAFFGRPRRGASPVPGDAAAVGKQGGSPRPAPAAPDGIPASLPSCPFRIIIRNSLTNSEFIPEWRTISAPCA